MTNDPPFEPPLWLRNAHLQTLGAALPLWSRGRASLRDGVSVRIPLSGEGDGAALHGRMHWQSLVEKGRRRSDAVALVHGVGGTSQSRYLARAARAFGEAGFHALRLDLRGAGEGLETAPSLYHAALTRDLAAAVSWLAASPDVDRVFVVGFSLGGHLALRWAGELGSLRPPRLAAIAALSAPLDLESTTEALERARSVPYHRYITRNLQRTARAFALRHPKLAHFTVRELDRVRSVRAYDSLVIAPMHGWRSAEDYYASASAAPWLPKIEVPCLVVHAEDDPMVPARLVRGPLAQASGAVSQSWSAYGGHVGWFAGFGERSWLSTWALLRVVEFFRGDRPVS